MSGACEVMYCCCQPDCVSTNLLCHGSAPGTIRIVGSSTYLRTLRMDLGSGLQDILIQAGSIEVELYGNYVGPQGEGSLGLGGFNLYGTATASITDNYVYSEYWIHYAHSKFLNPLQQVATYACGTIGENPGIITNVHETSSYGTDLTYQGGFRIGGRFCDPCLNPGLLCRGYMITSSPILDRPSFAFQGTEYASSLPDPTYSDVNTSTGTMTIEII